MFYFVTNFSLLLDIQPGEVLPDWTTIRRWMEKLDKIDELSFYRLRQLMALHYERSFNTPELIMPPEVSKRTGLSRHHVMMYGRDLFFRLGNKLYVETGLAYHAAFGKYLKGKE